MGTVQITEDNVDRLCMRTLAEPGGEVVREADRGWSCRYCHRPIPQIPARHECPAHAPRGHA